MQDRNSQSSLWKLDNLCLILSAFFFQVHFISSNKIYLEIEEAR
jgi:hypothetical protein